jgi:hypothetical protein
MTTTAMGEGKASFEVNTIREWVGPLHRQLIRNFNDRHESLEKDDREAADELDQLVPPLMEEFEATEAPRAENPQWLIWKMRAGWHVARGDYEEALNCEVEGYKHAEAEPDRPETRVATARRRSVSASNIADELRRLGRAHEALKWARLSIELWPSNTINHLVLAMAVYRAGYPAEAGRIIAELLNAVELGDDKDTLANCMAFERELHEMRDLDPAIRSLLGSLASRQDKKG